MSRILCVAAVCVCLTVPATPLARAQDAPTPSIETEDFEDLHARWRESDRLQLERPVEAIQIPDVETPRQSIGFFRWIASLFRALGPLLQLVFYLGLAALVAGILYFVFGQMLGIRFERDGGSSPDQPQDDVLTSNRPDERAARTLLEEADALARDGKFGEAVHLLLFRSIEDIQTRRDKQLPEALTAREIGALDDLPAEPRAALDPIIGLVEQNFFGGRDLVERDWTTARASYERFAFGQAWS